MQRANAVQTTENHFLPSLDKTQNDPGFKQSSKRTTASATQHKNYPRNKSAAAPKLTFSQAIGGAARTTLQNTVQVSHHIVREAKNYGFHAALHGWPIGAGLTALRTMTPSLMMQACLVYYQATSPVGHREASCTTLDTCKPYIDSFQASLDARKGYSDNIYLASTMELGLESLKWMGLTGLLGAAYGSVTGFFSGIKSLKNPQIKRHQD